MFIIISSSSSSSSSITISIIITITISIIIIITISELPQEVLLLARVVALVQHAHGVPGEVLAVIVLISLVVSLVLLLL